MIEHPQHQPVLPFLALGVEQRGTDPPEVVGFPVGLERHHDGDAFPRHEDRPDGVPLVDRLAPPRQEHGPPEGAEGADGARHRVRNGRRVLGGKTVRRKDGKTGGNDDRGANPPAVVPSYRRTARHCATSTVSRPGASVTRHSVAPGWRSSPSRCSSNGAPGERTTTSLVWNSTTSFMVVCVPRITRGIARRKRGRPSRRTTHTSSRPSAGSAPGANR